MIINPQEQARPHSPQEIADLVDRSSLQWVDQFNQNLTLTVQALQRLHTAFNGKFTQ